MSTRTILSVLVLALAACSKGSEIPPPAADPARPAAVLPPSLRLESAPSAAISVVEARAAADGTEVAVTGRVKDIVATRAVFTIADLSLKSCAEPGDTMDCETPWDYCCEDPARLAAGVATVEVRSGAELVTGTIQTWNGLDHLKSVVVVGKLTKDDKGNATIVASGIYVQS
jgi:hypothetical protein